MRKERFTPRKAVIYSEGARFVGYLTEEELRRILGTMIDLAMSEGGDEDESDA